MTIYVRNGIIEYIGILFFIILFIKNTKDRRNVYGEIQREKNRNGGIQMVNSKNSKKGITLIALIITIIVLLILAGVTMSFVVGDNGVVTQSQM